MCEIRHKEVVALMSKCQSSIIHSLKVWSVFIAKGGITRILGVPRGHCQDVVLPSKIEISHAAGKSTKAMQSYTGYTAWKGRYDYNMV